MATAKELALVNTIITRGFTDSGKPLFLREWTPVRYLGRGNFGEVYEIRRGRERSALKIVAMDDEFIDAYAAEIEALSRIRGERNAVRIDEYATVGVDMGPYIQRYLIIRMNLLNKLPRVMDEDEVIEMGLQLSGILNKCHSGTPKIYHCDIKPDNILRSDDGIYKLSDFGAAKISDKTHNSSGHRGTPLYMSPEMYNLIGYDNRSDLYSLGVTMYTQLNGGLPPFSDGTNSAQAIRMRFDGKKLPQIEGVSAGMMKILRKLCAAEPDKRYRSAQELGRDLAALADARRKQREAEEEAERRKAEQEAARRAAEAAKRRAAEQAAVAAARNDPFASTEFPGQRAVEPVTGQKRRPLGIIATAAALVAAIVLGAVFIPGLSKKDGKTESQQPGAVSGAVSQTDINITAEVSENVPYLSEVTDLSVGDHVLFGSYPQTADGEVQPIEWRVLDIEDGNALMISEYLLDCKPYNEEYTDVTWETCTLREWLNDDFYNAAFSAKEQSEVVLRKNINSSTYIIDGGNPTEDRVFCLSRHEVINYFSNSEDRKARRTAYLSPNRIEDWWWLRSPGDRSDDAASVYTDGGVKASSVETGDVCVRPVVSVSLSAES